MKIYIKHILVGLTLSYLIFVIPPVFDKPREIVVLLFVAPFFYGALLKYPLIVLAILAVLLREMKVKSNPYFFSTSLVIFTIATSIVGYFIMTNLISETFDGSTWKIWMISILSCTISFLVIYKKRKIKQT